LKSFIKILFLGLVALTVSGITAQDDQPSWLFYQVFGRPTSPGTARFVYRMDMESGETVRYGMGDINISPNGQNAVFFLQTGSYYTDEMIVLDLKQEPPPDGFKWDEVEGETIGGYGFDWHPSGDRFAIFWQPDFKIVNVDGSATDYKLREIYSEALEDDYISSFEGKWSPDGEHMLMSFYGSQPMNHGLYWFDVAAKKLEQISQEDLEPVAWRPDSKQAIVATKTEDAPLTRQCISLVTVASGDLTDLYCEQTLDEHLRYRPSPDGTRLLLQTMNSAGNYFLRVLDTTRPNPVTTLSMTCCSLVTAQWSPDGTQIAAVFNTNETSNELYVMNADGQDAHQIAQIQRYINLIEWSPAGTEITFAYQDADNKYHLDKIAANGTNHETLTQTDYGFLSLDWIPQPHD
jgi:dipeptidyl aminopeptidase/acylaminoacyl peptidase